MEELSKHVNESLKKAAEILRGLREDLARFKDVANKPGIRTTKRAASGQEFNDRLNEGLSGLQAALGEAAAASANLLEALPPLEGILTGDLVNGFRSIMDNIQRDARDPAKGDVGATLQSLDIEMKGFITLQQSEARIITPTLTRAADPGQLSTIRLAFGAIPVLRPEEETT